MRARDKSFGLPSALVHPKSVPIISASCASHKSIRDRRIHGAIRTLYKLSVSLMYNRVADRLVMTAEEGVRDAVEAWGIKPEALP